MESSEKIRAIETRYRGRHFRSRLEARWAIFFDALKIPWDYEAEGYDLPSGRYLPDFWLPEQDCWLEIKGRTPTDHEILLGCELRDIAKKNVFIFHSGMDYGYDSDRPAGSALKCLGLSKSLGVPTADYRYRWAQCDTCGRFEIVFDGQWNRMSCKSAEPACPQSRFGAAQTLIRLAFGEALSARFEFGEG